MTAAMILSGSAVHVKGLGIWFVSATKRLMAAWRSTTPLKTPRLRRRLARMAKKPSPGGSPKVTGAPWVLNRSRPPKYQSAWAAPAGTRSSARSSGVHMLVVTLPGRAGKKRKNDMDSAKRCRDESAECLRLMKLAQSETEARVLRDLAHSWVRLANQTDRYTALVKSNGPHRAEVMPPQGTGVARRSGTKLGVAHQRFPLANRSAPAA